jgi:hypothetical protein
LREFFMAVNNDATRRSARYSARGAIARNGNFDGSAVTAQRLLGVPENVNLNQSRSGYSILNAASQGVILIRVDESPVQIKPVSFAHAVDIENVTPAETVIAINGARFAGINAIIDNETGAANIQAVNPGTECVQIFGVLAGALGFGGGKPFRSCGCFLYDGLSWKDIVQLTTARQAAEEAVVSLANGYDGGTTDVARRGGRTGDQVTWSVRNKDYLLLQLAEGGLLTVRESGGIGYDEPSSGDDVGERNVELWAVYPDFEDGVRQTLDEESFITVKHYFKGRLTPRDDSEGGSAIATVNFLFDASAIYFDPDGGRMVNPHIDKMTIDEWRVWKLKSCLIPGLSAASTVVRPASALTLGSPVLNMVKNQVAYNKLGTTPSNAGGYSITFPTPATLTDIEIGFDPDTKRVRVKAGNTAGTETVTVTLTNGDASSSTVTAAFTIVVV